MRVEASAENGINLKDKALESIEVGIELPTMTLAGKDILFTRNTNAESGHI